MFAGMMSFMVCFVGNGAAERPANALCSGAPSSVDHIRLVGDTRALSNACRMCIAQQCTVVRCGMFAVNVYVMWWHFNERCWQLNCFWTNVFAFAFGRPQSEQQLCLIISACDLRTLVVVVYSGEGAQFIYQAVNEPFTPERHNWHTLGVYELDIQNGCRGTIWD